MVRPAARFGPSTTDSFGTSTHSPSIRARVTVLGFAVGIVDTLRITAIAARPLATMQALIPTLQLGLFMIVGASITDCRHRQNVSETNDRCIAPRAIVHLKPNPDHLLGNGCEGLPINAMIMLIPSACREVSQSRAIVCNLANFAAWSVYRLRARTITQSKPWLGGPTMPALMQNTNDVATAVWPG
jgi:hypothetical protein